MSRSARPLALVVLVLLVPIGVAARPGDVQGDRPLEHYVGSFELSTGEVITGGPFVERADGPVRFLYMETQRLERWAVFERESDLVLRSVQPPGSVTLRFELGPGGEISTLEWSDSRGAVRGRRVAPHDTREVKFASSDGREITGRLLVPRCPGPRPLVVLVGGSGPTTRWAGTFETFFVRLGMAALVYDKRGVGEPDWSEPDFAALAADAAAALRAGAAEAGIDPDRAGLWASSQGGWVAPMAAVEERPAFLVVRVGPGVSEMETLLHEVRQETRGAGLTGLDLDHATALRRELYELAATAEPLSTTDAVVAPYLDEDWYVTAFGEGPVSARWSEGWWERAARNFLIEPASYVERLDTPILWFLAEDDENVPLVPSRTRLSKAFAASPGTDQSLVVIPDANHAFFRSTGEGGLRYAEGYFERVKEWLAERGLSDEDCWSRAPAAQDGP